MINVVNGFGNTAGAAVSSHMDIDAVRLFKFFQTKRKHEHMSDRRLTWNQCFQVTFTGSTKVGRAIMQASATSNLKPVFLELGGKSPFIVFDDADVDQAVELAVVGNLVNKVRFKYYSLDFVTYTH